MMNALRRALVALICTLTLPALAAAHDYKLGDLQIGHPWTRATPGPNGGAFLTITNNGTTPDTLISAASSAAGKV